MSIEEQSFMLQFMTMCADACVRGWHEANGGNLSYLLDDIDIELCMGDFHHNGEWLQLAHTFPELAGCYILITASGAYLSNIARAIEDPGQLEASAGIIKLDAEGDEWRPVWGFANGALPSSELETHLAAFQAAFCAGEDCRVIYHAHCPHVLALSALLEPDPRTWTRMLWQIMTESIVVFPQGIGVLPWMVPGSPELAQATVEVMAEKTVCVWTHHGIMARATSFDEVFGLIDTVEKSAGVYLQALAANGGEQPPHLVSDAQLCAICARYDISPNTAFFE